MTMNSSSCRIAERFSPRPGARAIPGSLPPHCMGDHTSAIDDFKPMNNQPRELPLFSAPIGSRSPLQILGLATLRWLSITSWRANNRWPLGALVAQPAACTSVDPTEAHLTLEVTDGFMQRDHGPYHQMTARSSCCVATDANVTLLLSASR